MPLPQKQTDISKAEGHRRHGGHGPGDLALGSAHDSGRRQPAVQFIVHGTVADKKKMDVLFPFGYGLSYTTFGYSELRLENGKLLVNVENTGRFDADEVVQLYIDSAGLDNQPKVRLKGFKRIHLKPNESKTVEFVLNDESFSLFDESGKRKVFSGEYTVFIDGHLPDDSSESLELNIL